MKFQFAQHWPAAVAAYETAITGLILFGVWGDPDPDQLAWVMGLPAIVAGFLAPRTHASKAVLEELE